MESICRWAKQWVVIGLVFALFVPVANAAGTSKKCVRKITTAKNALKAHMKNEFAEMYKILKETEKKRLKAIDAAYKKKIKNLASDYKASKNHAKLGQDAKQLWQDITRAAMIRKTEKWAVSDKIRVFNEARTQNLRGGHAHDSIMGVCAP